MTVINSLGQDFQDNWWQWQAVSRIDGDYNWPHVGHMNLADRLTVCNMRCYSLMGDYYCLNMNLTVTKKLYTQIVRFMGPTWGLPGASRTHIGPMNLDNSLTVCHVRCYLLKFAIHFVVHISSNICTFVSQQYQAVTADYDLWHNLINLFYSKFMSW